jgi:peptidoglycan hydrolase-like protein with peptidoglycan-binding domain
LRQFYAQLVPARVPDLTVRAVQVGLTYNGIDPQGIDGDLGPATRAAITAFQTQAGLATTGIIDDTLLAALSGDQTTAKSPDL